MQTSVTTDLLHYVLYCNQPFGNPMMFRRENVSSSHAECEFHVNFRQHALHPSRQTDCPIQDRAPYRQDRRGAFRSSRGSILTIYGLVCMAVTCWCNNRLPSPTRRWLTDSLLNDMKNVRLAIRVAAAYETAVPFAIAQTYIDYGQRTFQNLSRIDLNNFISPSTRRVLLVQASSPVS